MSGAVHHAVIVVSDLEKSVRFYRDGLGLDVIQDRQVEGDWPALFGAPARTLRAVFLGDAGLPDDHSGVVELNAFDGEARAAPPSEVPRAGLFMLSYFVDLEATLGRLAGMGLGGTPRRVEQTTPTGSISIATVRDPDGVTILLTPGSITRKA